MADGGIDGLALGSIAAGSVFLWAALQGKTILGTVQALIKGSAPGSAPSSPPIGGTTTTAATGNAAYNSSSSLQQLWTSNGGPQNTAAFAAAVAEAESGGNTPDPSSNPDGGTNIGPWQLDTKGVGAGYTEAQLANPNLNAQITIMATNGGTDWTEWDDPVVNALPGHQYTPGSPVP